METKIRNIMLAFVSLVNERSVEKPIAYPNIEGKPYTAIQTNEAAIVAVQRMFPQRPLSDLFLIVSKDVQTGIAPVPEGETPCTHQQFLERRLLKEYPALAGHFHYFSYTDSVDNMDQNLLDMAEIARGILAYARQYPDEKIIVHADMTGGMRHVSMMMLSIMQMLKYSGIVIGEVLYSDPRQCRVYKATQIQRMFTLINGADEFVKFGSVNAIKEYFHNKEVSPQLQHLLDCMERFSQTIHLCQTESMQPVLEQLRVAIAEFQSYEHKDLQEQLFNGLLSTVRKEYGKLLSADSSVLDIIRWCLSNEFWQQALTLCTERLPIYLVEHRIAYTDNTDLQNFCAEEGKLMSRNWQQDFIITCSRDAGKLQSDGVKAVRKILRQKASHQINLKQAQKKIRDFVKLYSFLYEYEQGQAEYNRCYAQGAGWGRFAQQYPFFMEMLQTIYKARQETSTYTASFSQFVEKLPYKKVFDQVAVMPERFLKPWLGETESTPQLSPKTYELDATPLTLSTGKDKRWQNRQKEYRNMYQTKSLQSKLDYYDMIKFLRGYFDIRQKRNEINHANADEEISLKALSDYITSYLDSLEKVQ